MTLEQRLVDALHSADGFDPSLDLFARVERSIDEDRQFRRRRLYATILVLLGTTIVGSWLGLSVSVGFGGRLMIDAVNMAIAHLALSAGIIVALAPTIRRFGRAFLDDVFHLSPETGTRLTLMLDIAYYAAFTGLSLIDADSWELGRVVPLAPALESLATRLGALLLVMGVLHAVNIAFLPILGLVHNSIVRRHQREIAGAAAPPESARARGVDGSARAIAIALFIAAVALGLAVVALVAGGID